MVYEWVLKSIINDKLSNGKDLALQKQITRRLPRHSIWDDLCRTCYMSDK